MKKQNITALAVVLSAMALLTACATAPPEELHEPDTMQHLSAAAADISGNEDEPTEYAESEEESGAENSQPNVVPSDTMLRQQSSQQSKPSGTPTTNTPCEQTQQAQTERMERNGIGSTQLQGVDAGNNGNPASNENSGQSGSSRNNTPGSNDTLTIINEARAAAGVSALSTNAILNQAAQVRAEEAQVLYSHTRPCSRDFRTVIVDMGYSTGRSSSENLAGRVVTWLDSPGHYANLINSNWTHVGIGSSSNITVAIFMNGISQPIADSAPQPQNPTPLLEAQPPPQENTQPSQESVPPPGPTTAPVTGFDCPQPYYSCYCTPGNPCSP